MHLWAAAGGRRRLVLGGLIALLHGLAVALLLLSMPPQRHDVVLERVLTLVSRPASPVPVFQPPAPPPTRDLVILNNAPPEIAIAQTVSSTSAFDVQSGGDCAIERSVAEALARDPAAVAALAMLGPVRADTGVVMLWNGEWAVPADPADAARLAVLRPIMDEAIARCPVYCREAELVGPRLIAVSGQSRATLLAVGSGRWRWDAIARSNRP